MSPSLSSSIDRSDLIEHKYFFSDFRYALLHVLDFDSTRKRMSVIVKSPRGIGSKQIKKSFFEKAQLRLKVERALGLCLHCYTD